MIETEITGEINKVIFESKLKDFTLKFGNPKVKKRLGLMVFDRNNPGIDTRIRITNGETEIMQKVTISDDKTGHAQKEELSIPIKSDVDIIYNAFMTYTNLLLNKYSEKLVRLLVQTENYIWKNDDYELKISHQFGKNDYYTFEIEAVKENVDIKEIQKELKLEPTKNFASDERKKFRRTQVDLSASELTEADIKNIISKYI